MSYETAMEYERLPKLCGADVEVGNFVLGLSRPGGTGYEASRALLREIDGLPQREERDSGNWFTSRRGGRWEEEDRESRSGWYDTRRISHSCENDGAWSQDWGRKYLPANGGCVYIDLNHLELCLPEVLSAYDHVAAWHAMLRVAREALHAANGRQPRGQRIQVLVNNSDGQENSYGSHLDFLITRAAFDNLFYRKVHQLLFLAAYQVSSIVFTGQGKVGAERGTPAAAYQLSQRADFFETLLGPQTTHYRPIVNSRDEALCGPRRHAASGNTEPGKARLHVIFFDSTLAHTACLLKVGVMQIILAMIEAGCTNPALVLDDPVEAVVRYSHDPALEARARLASGAEFTAVELQMRFLEEARRFAERGGCEGIVPRAGEILGLWEETLGLLARRDMAALAPRLDWALKYCVLERARAGRPDLDWDSAQLKHLDHLYSSLDENEGLYWHYERAGLAERIVPEERIAYFTSNPPEETRAWTRAMLLRSAAPESVDEVDWDSLRFRTRGRVYWPSYRKVDLSDPLGHTRAENEALFERCGNLTEILDALEERQDGPPAGEAQAQEAAQSVRAYLPN